MFRDRSLENPMRCEEFTCVKAMVAETVSMNQKMWIEILKTYFKDRSVIYCVSILDSKHLQTVKKIFSSIKVPSKPKESIIREPSIRQALGSRSMMSLQMNFDEDFDDEKAKTQYRLMNKLALNLQTSDMLIQIKKDKYGFGLQPLNQETPCCVEELMRVYHATEENERPPENTIRRCTGILTFKMINAELWPQLTRVEKIIQKMDKVSDSLKEYWIGQMKLFHLVHDLFFKEVQRGEEFTECINKFQTEQPFNRNELMITLQKIEQSKISEDIKTFTELSQENKQFVCDYIGKSEISAELCNICFANPTTENLGCGHELCKKCKVSIGRAERKCPFCRAMFT